MSRDRVEKSIALEPADAQIGVLDCIEKLHVWGHAECIVGIQDDVYTEYLLIAGIAGCSILCVCIVKTEECMYFPLSSPQI